MQRNIDMVYLWVDDNDLQWRQRKNDFLKTRDGLSIDASCKGRFSNNDELKYSLRSLAKYMPWINHIYIVTDRQQPEWLDTAHPKITVVDHSAILPEEALPCYNSVVLEYFLYRIPNLSEYFLYGNDDTFANKPLTEDTFFTADGKPVIRLRRKRFGTLRIAWKLHKGIELSLYKKTLLNAQALVKKKTGKSFSVAPHHNIDPYLRSCYQEAIEEVFAQTVQATCCNHFRTADDLERLAVHLYTIVTGHAKTMYLHSRYRSCSMNINVPDYGEYLRKYDPELFCMNDGETASDADRRRLKDFLAHYFPDKSPFEK
jgi:hypothetical protein